MSNVARSYIVEIGFGFYNVRAPFKVLCNCIDVGTQMSIIKLNSGKFLIIDTIHIHPILKTELDELTDNGNLIEAVLATHPFHTMYFSEFYQLYPNPNIKYYGCPRHLRNIPSIPWSGSFENQSILQLWESEEIYLRIPSGAEFINPPEYNHFTSVFVFHQLSHTLHVDDTIGYFQNPGCLLQCLTDIKPKLMNFWSLDRGLLHTSDASYQFKQFIQSIIDDWDFNNICIAHSSNVIGNICNIYICSILFILLIYIVN